jgi:hypothetical protein
MMFKRILILGVMLYTALLLPAVVQGQDDAPVPLIMLTEFDPWQMVLGSDTPTIVVYDTGQVIYVRTNDEGDYEHATVHLSEDELEALLDRLFVSEENREDFFELEPYYDLLLMTDQPTSRIVALNGDDLFSVGVYGNLRESGEARNLAPEAFVNVFDQLIAYEHPDAEPWLPEQFEVILWEYDDSEPTPWPANWPDLDDPTTVKRNDVYSLYIDIDELDKFYALAEEASAFLLDGQTWTFSLRFPFPHELPST